MFDCYIYLYDEDYAKCNQKLLRLLAMVQDANQSRKNAYRFTESRHFACQL